ncbi:hypothetical protein DYH09_07330 [bacterium CPR1]|nr:hypothetical protein [bacterium CPR1]
MALRFFNTLTRALEEFRPIEPGKVRLYTCGPTVYNFAHIGNFRTYVFEDVLRRTLKYFGYEVTQVMNLTDVDDRTTVHKVRAAFWGQQGSTSKSGSSQSKRKVSSVCSLFFSHFF